MSRKRQVACATFATAAKNYLLLFVLYTLQELFFRLERKDSFSAPMV